MGRGRPAFLWLSERDGFSTSTVFRANGGTRQLITKFDADVTDIAGLDEKARLGVFPRLAGQCRHSGICIASKLDGSDTPERVTPADQPGTHRYDISPNGKMAFHTYSQFEMPPRDGGDRAAEPQAGARAHRSNSRWPRKSQPLLKPPAEFFRVDIGDGVSSTAG